MPDVQKLASQLEYPASPVAPAFYRIADVVRLTSLSRATVYRRIADGRFPKPVHLGGRACGWTPEELQAWIDDPTQYRAVTTAPATQEIRPRRNRRRLNLSRFSNLKSRTQIGHEGLRQEKRT